VPVLLAYLPPLLRRSGAVGYSRPAGAAVHIIYFASAALRLNNFDYQRAVQLRRQAFYILLVACRLPLLVPLPPAGGLLAYTSTVDFVPRWRVPAGGLPLRSIAPASLSLSAFTLDVLTSIPTIALWHH